MKRSPQPCGPPLGVVAQQRKSKLLWNGTLMSEATGLVSFCARSAESDCGAGACCGEPPNVTTAADAT